MLCWFLPAGIRRYWFAGTENALYCQFPGFHNQRLVRRQGFVSQTSPHNIQIPGCHQLFARPTQRHIGGDNGGHVRGIQDSESVRTKFQIYLAQRQPGTLYPAFQLSDTCLRNHLQLLDTHARAVEQQLALDAGVS